MRADGLADRLKRALALLALAAPLALGAPAAGSQPPSDVMLVQQRSAAAARAIGRFYAAENDGVKEAYQARALAAGAAVGLSERCRLASGTLSRRPTVLANPPLAATSIAQREQLAATLGAFEGVLITLAEKLPQRDVALAESELQAKLIELGAAANAHAQGDLFIEDATKAFGAAVERVRAAGDAEPQLRALEAADAEVRKLSDILAADLVRQRTQSVDASTLAYRGWSAYRATAANPARPADDTSDLPMCSEPAVYAHPNARPSAAAGDRGSGPGGAIGDRAVRARQRLDAIAKADPGAVVAALAALDASEIRALRWPRDRTAAAAAKAALAHFTAVVGDLGDAFGSDGAV